MRKFTGKFKKGDKVICVKKRCPEANMQIGDTGIITEVDRGWKKYDVKIDNKERGRDFCWMWEFEIEDIKQGRLRLIETKAKERRARCIRK